MDMIIYRLQLTVVIHYIIFAKEILQFICSSIPIVFFISLHSKYDLRHFTAMVTDPYKSRIKNQFIPDISC